MRYRPRVTIANLTLIVALVATSVGWALETRKARWAALRAWFAESRYTQLKRLDALGGRSELEWRSARERVIERYPGATARHLTIGRDDQPPFEWGIYAGPEPESTRLGWMPTEEEAWIDADSQIFLNEELEGSPVSPFEMIRGDGAGSEPDGGPE